MTRLTILAASLLMAVAAPYGQETTRPAAAGPGRPPTHGQTITISQSATRQATLGPAEYFTGAARLETVIRPAGPSRVSGASVSFEPRARTAWHTHPLGQTLIVTAGTGWVQQEGGARQAIKVGDVVWTPPGMKHWHGAAAFTSMTHLAIQEALDGKNVEWMEHVSDGQYGK